MCPRNGKVGLSSVVSSFESTPELLCQGTFVFASFGKVLAVLDSSRYVPDSSVLCAGNPCTAEETSAPTPATHAVWTSRRRENVLPMQCSASSSESIVYSGTSFLPNIFWCPGDIWYRFPRPQL